MQEHKSFLIKDLLSDVLNGTHNEGKHRLFYIFFGLILHKKMNYF